MDHLHQNLTRVDGQKTGRRSRTRKCVCSRLSRRHRVSISAVEAIWSVHVHRRHRCGIAICQGRAVAHVSFDTLVIGPMNSRQATTLYQRYACALAYVDILRPNGDRGIGSAFHVGNGVFVTARHVVEGNSIVEIKITEPIAIDTREFLSIHAANPPDENAVKRQEQAYEKVTGVKPMYKHYMPSLQIVDGPFFSNANSLDVAVFRVREIHINTPAIPLGFHWDDWVIRGPWQLSDAIVLGYPPVPMVNEPLLIPARAEVHTYICPRHAPKIHFILSATPRGGFSGGVAIHENGEALGVITSSLVENEKMEELGFFTVLSIEGVVQCLEEFQLFPEFQRVHHESKLSSLIRPQ